MKYPSCKTLGTALLLATLGLTPAVASDQAQLAQAVEARIERFDEIDRLFKSMRFRVVTPRHQDLEAAYEYAQAMSQQTQGLVELFDHPSDRSQFRFSKARPSIWQNKSDFDAQMLQMQQQFQQLEDLIAAQDVDAAERLIDQTARSCRACHNSYRFR